MPERKYSVAKIYIMPRLTAEEAYTAAMRFRRQGYGSEIFTDESVPEHYAHMQDLTPFERELGLRQDAPREP
jgi:hypothetical protein